MEPNAASTGYADGSAKPPRDGAEAAATLDPEVDVGPMAGTRTRLLSLTIRS